MDYLQKLLTRAFSDAWDLVFDRTFWSAMIALGIFFGTFWYLRCRKQHEEAKQSLRDFGIAALITALAFFAIFLLHVLFFTPAVLYSEERAAKIAAEGAKTKAEIDLAATKTSTPAPFQLEVNQTDPQAREQIKQLETKLREAYATIEKLKPVKRSLTKEQRSELVEALKNTGEQKIAIRCEPMTPESQEYADQFASVFREAGWEVVNPKFMVVQRTAIGIFILVRDLKVPFPRAVALQRALTSVGIAANGVEVPALQEGLIELAIGFPEDITRPSPTPNKEASQPSPTS